MPLIHSKTPKAFKKNIETEMQHGKPQSQAVAIAYAEKAKAEHKKHLDQGGMVEDCPLCSQKEPAADQDIPGVESDNPLAGYAEGGSVSCSNCHGAGCYECKDPMKMASGGGVHNPNNMDRASGISVAGANLRRAQKKKEGSEDNQGYPADSENQEAKLLHHGVLNDLKTIKKPKLYADGGGVGLDADFVHNINKQTKSEPQSAPSPNPGSTPESASPSNLYMAEGGKVDEEEEMVDAPLLDDEMKEKLGKELSECMKNGNHRGILDCIEAIVHSLK